MGILSLSRASLTINLIFYMPWALTLRDAGIHFYYLTLITLGLGLFICKSSLGFGWRLCLSSCRFLWLVICLSSRGYLMHQRAFFFSGFSFESAGDSCLRLYFFRAFSLIFITLTSGPGMRFHSRVSSSVRPGRLIWILLCNIFSAGLSIIFFAFESARSSGRPFPNDTAVKSCQAAAFWNIIINEFTFIWERLSED